jgi:hypothetical protein
MNNISSQIQYEVVNDGEQFALFQYEDGEFTDCVLMKRDFALELAKVILNEFIITGY